MHTPDNPYPFHIRSLGNNPLECDCHLYYTLTPWSYTVNGGDCAGPPELAGVTLDWSQNTQTHFYLNQNETDVLCGKYNVCLKSL